MPAIKCPYSGCVYNSSNIIEKAGICQYTGTVEMVQVDDDRLDCMEFRPRPLEEMKKEATA